MSYKLLTYIWSEFLSKVIEKVVSSRLSCHMAQYNVFEVNQKAYRKGHSTETALLRIQNDLLLSANNRCASCLVLLVLCAAFDTIDHQVLVSRLSKKIGRWGTALNRFTSYLENKWLRLEKPSRTCPCWHAVSPKGLSLGTITVHHIHGWWTVAKSDNMVWIFICMLMIHSYTQHSRSPTRLLPYLS